MKGNYPVGSCPLKARGLIRYEQADELAGMITIASRMNIPCNSGVCGNYFTNPNPTEGELMAQTTLFYTTVFLNPSGSLVDPNRRIRTYEITGTAY